MPHFALVSFCFNEFGFGFGVSHIQMKAFW